MVPENEPMPYANRTLQCAHCRQPSGIARFCSNICAIRHEAMISLLPWWKRLWLVFKPR